ncbi:hypothetical protein [Aeromonas hydrophila]|uniref:hypothetical protein n=1 Tax=Aeromonas hydrophila TaxID=644 RepID=UPI00366FF7DA
MLPYRFSRLFSVLEMKLYRMFRSIRGVIGLTPKWLTWSTLFCLSLIIINALVWDHWPEPFSGAAALSSAAVDLLLAYVAGYIFYVLTTVSTEYKKQQFIYFSVMRYQVTIIAQAYAGLLSGLVKQGQYISPFDAFDIYGSKEGQPLLVEATAKLSVDDSALTAQQMSWLEQMAGVSLAEDRAIKKMLRYELELELDVRTLLVSLLDTDYKEMISVMSDPKNKEEDRSFKPIIYMMHRHLASLAMLQNIIFSVIAGKVL